MPFSAIWNNKTFGESIYTCKASIVEAEEDRSNLLKNLVEFHIKSRPKNKEGKDKKVILWKCIALCEGQEFNWFQKWNISNKNKKRWRTWKYQFINRWFKNYQ